LSELEEEKKKILQNLHQTDGWNSQTSYAAQNLQIHLQGIEEEQRCLLEEKQEIEERYCLSSYYSSQYLLHLASILNQMFIGWSVGVSSIFL